MPSEAQKRATYKYQKNKIKPIRFAVNVDTEADILERLNEVPYKQTYIKDLIRKDIQENPNLYDSITE